MSPIPLSILGGVFVAWLLGVVLVWAVLRGEGDRSPGDDDPDTRRRTYSR